VRSARQYIPHIYTSKPLSAIHSKLLVSSLLNISLLSVAVPMLVPVAMTMRVRGTTSLPVATALHSSSHPGRSAARLRGVSSFRRGLQRSELGVALFAERLELAALLVEQRDVVVAVAVGFVARSHGVVAQFAGVEEGGGQGLDFDLVFGAFLWRGWVSKCYLYDYAKREGG